MQTTTETTTSTPDLAAGPTKRPTVYDLAESDRLIALARQAPDDHESIYRLLADQLEAAGRLLVQGDVASNILEVDRLLDASKAQAPAGREAAEGSTEMLERQLAAAHDRIAELCDRSGPEELAPIDLELAAWLGTVAGTHPLLHDPTAPLAWPAEARRQLEGLISKYRVGETTSGELPRAEQLRVAAAIHELCEANDCGVETMPDELADAIILDDDREWQRRYTPGVN